MTPPDPGRLDRLARRLDLSPRLLLALVGRIAAADAPLDAARLRDEVARVRAAGGAAADLAMLPFAAYAIDELDRALALAVDGQPARDA